MYIPPSFKEERPEVLHALMRERPLALLVSHGPDGLDATPVPFVFYAPENAQGLGVLRAHLARANPLGATLAEAPACLVIFQGEHGYVTPSWYPSKAEGGRVVPTWNYVTVHAHGQARMIDDPAWLRRQLQDLSQAQEGRRARPWSLDDAPEDYLARQMKAIVGLEIPIERLEGKWKLSQNKDEADRRGVIAGLQTPGDAHADAALAERMLHSPPRR